MKPYKVEDYRDSDESPRLSEGLKRWARGKVRGCTETSRSSEAVRGVFIALGNGFVSNWRRRAMAHQIW